MGTAGRFLRLVCLCAEQEWIAYDPTFAETSYAGDELDLTVG